MRASQQNPAYQPTHSPSVNTCKNRHVTDETKSAGWYSDPDGTSDQRWWNGVDWSDSHRPAPVATPVASPGMPPVGVVYSAENPPPQSPDDPVMGGQYIPAQGVTPTLDTRINRNAFIGLVIGIIAFFANILFVLAPVGLVFSILGVVKARELRKQGAPRTNMAFAFMGVVLCGYSMIIGVVQIVQGISFIN
jgi:hypothetical protein